MKFMFFIQNKNIILLNLCKGISDYYEIYFWTTIIYLRIIKKKKKKKKFKSQ